jgi:hypothetical protein
VDGEYVLARLRRWPTWPTCLPRKMRGGSAPRWPRPGPLPVSNLALYRPLSAQLPDHHDHARPDGACASGGRPPLQALRPFPGWPGGMPVGSRPAGCAPPSLHHPSLRRRLLRPSSSSRSLTRNSKLPGCLPGVLGVLTWVTPALVRKQRAREAGYAQAARSPVGPRPGFACQWGSGCGLTSYDDVPFKPGSNGARSKFLQSGPSCSVTPYSRPNMDPPEVSADRHDGDASIGSARIPAKGEVVGRAGVPRGRLPPPDRPPASGTRRRMPPAQAHQAHHRALVCVHACGPRGRH